MISYNYIKFVQSMFSGKRQTFIADPRDLLGITKGKNMFYILFYSFLESY